MPKNIYQRRSAWKKKCSLWFTSHFTSTQWAFIKMNNDLAYTHISKMKLNFWAWQLRNAEKSANKVKVLTNIYCKFFDGNEKAESIWRSRLKWLRWIYPRRSAIWIFHLRKISGALGNPQPYTQKRHNVLQICADGAHWKCIAWVYDPTHHKYYRIKISNEMAASCLHTWIPISPFW